MPARPSRPTRPARTRRRTRRRQSKPLNIWDHWKTHGAHHIVYPKRNHLTLDELDSIPYVNEHGRRISITQEREEQYVCHAFIHPSNTVLELGARYGMVSSVINHKLERPTHHVVVDPDASVQACLKDNRRTHRCGFHVVHGIISEKPKYLETRGYGTRTMDTATATATATAGTPAVPIPIYSIHDMQQLGKGGKGTLHFDTLVADCEGCLEAFVKENLVFVTTQLRNIVFEADLPKRCNYRYIRSVLREAGFRVVIDGFVSYWRRTGTGGKR